MTLAPVLKVYKKNYLYAKTLYFISSDKMYLILDTSSFSGSYLFYYVK